MSGVEVVTEIVQILGSGIVGLGEKIGEGVSKFAQALAFTTVGTGSDATTEMSVFFILICTFAAIGLAVGITRLIFGWLQSLGN